MLRDAQRQRLQPAAERVGRVRIHHRADQPARLLDRRDQRLRAGDHAAGDVAVAVQVFRRALHRQIDAERQRLLVDRAGERVVDHRQHAARAARLGDRAGCRRSAASG